MTMTRTAERPKVLAASTLTGNVVRNPKGEDLGTIQELMIDIDSGRIGYCVLSFGGFLGMGNRLFAVPWEAMRLDTLEHCFTLDVNKERLAKAPGFDKDDWPDMTDREWGKGIYGFYEVKPYWTS